MQLTEETAAAVKLIVGILERQRTDLTGTCVHTVIQLATDDDTRADARTHRQTHHIAGALTLAVAPGAEGEAVGIVVHGYGHPELLLKDLLQMNLLPGRDVGDVIDDALPVVDHRRHTYANARHFCPHQLGYLPFQLVEYDRFRFFCGTGLDDRINDLCPVGEAHTHVGASQIYGYFHFSFL